MKILLTSDQSPATVNGVIVSALNLKRELENMGQDVRFLSLSPTKESYREGNLYYIRSLPFNIYPDVRASLASRDPLIQELIDWCPDIIHSQCEFFTYSFVRRIARRCRCPIVHTYHTMYEHYVRYVLPFQQGSSLVGPVMRARLADADVIIAPTVKARDFLYRHQVSTDIRIIPTGIDLQKYEQRISRERRSALLSELDLPDGVPVYGSVGRLAEEKNYSEILRALRHVLDAGGDSYLLLTGDGAYRQALEKEVDALQLRDRVRFAGMVPFDRIYESYQLLDVFLSASVSETQGLTYIEALANQVPVLARKDSALEGVVESGVNGWTYTTEEELVQRWLTLLAHPEQVQQAREGAYDSRERFGTKRFGERVYQLYEEILARENPPKHCTIRPTVRLRAHLQSKTQRSDYGKAYEAVRARWNRSRFRRKNDPNPR